MAELPWWEKQKQQGAFGRSQPRPARDHTGMGGPVGAESRKASAFGDRGDERFGQLGTEGDALRRQLRDQASGRVSLSAEQLRQGLQQSLAGQQAMAASARPANAAMAARTAAIQGGRAASGLAGQQATAGIMERQAAQQSLGNFLNAQRGQELQAAMGGRGQAMGGYQWAMDEEARRRAEEEARGSKWGQLGGALVGGAIGFGLGGPGGAAAGAKVGSGLGKDW